MPNELVLLTATVRPNTQMFVVQQDPYVRLRQYRRALSALVAQLPGGVDVVVLETSGASAEDLLTDVPHAYRHRVRLDSVEPDEGAVARGKGAIEAEIIRHGVSSIWNDFGDSVTIHKLTGRLLLRNARLLLGEVSPRVVRLRMTADRSFADTRFIASTARGWLDVILADAAKVDERSGVYLEHAVAGAVARAAALGEVDIERFAVRPDLAGESGSTGRVYRNGLTGWLPTTTRLAEGALAAVAARKQV